jgi:hypothetical protein
MTPDEQQVRKIIKEAFIDNRPSNKELDSNILEQLEHMYNDIPYNEWKGYLHCITDQCVRGSWCSDFVVTVFTILMGKMNI